MNPKSLAEYVRNMNYHTSIVDVSKSLDKENPVVVTDIQDGIISHHYFKRLYDCLPRETIVIDITQGHHAITYKRLVHNYLSVGMMNDSASVSGSHMLYKKVEPIIGSLSSVSEHFMRSTSALHIKNIYTSIHISLVQVISEAWSVLYHLGYTNPEISFMFKKWNTYALPVLDEIASQLRNNERCAYNDCVESPIDVENTLSLSLPIPTLIASLNVRQISQGSRCVVNAPHLSATHTDIDIEDLRQALYASIICIYIQGFESIPPDEKKKVKTLWSQGTDIHSTILLNDCSVIDTVASIPSMRRVVSTVVQSGLPCPSMSASLQYIECMIQPHLCTNLVNYCDLK